jgi:hypothetical protein
MPFDSRTAIGPCIADIAKITNTVQKLFGDRDGAVLDQLAGLNTSFAGHAFAIPAPLAHEAKARFDDYVQEVFGIVQKKDAQAATIRARCNAKVLEIIQSFATTFVSEVNEAAEGAKLDTRERVRAASREGEARGIRAASPAQSRASSPSARSQSPRSYQVEFGLEDGSEGAEMAERWAKREKALQGKILALKGLSDQVPPAARRCSTVGER